MATEIYSIPQGQIIIQYSTPELSIGLVKLNPGESLARHSRPVNEELVQIYGQSQYTLYENDSEKSVNLDENERIIIPAYQEHIHSNVTNEVSITLWRFKGDITEIIENIRASSKIIN